MSARVVTCGEAMLRLTAPAGERLESSRRLDSYVAGAEANVAVALARLGVPTAWLSALPDSPLGERVADELAAAGVDLTFVERVPGARLGLFFVERGAEPRATRVWYDRAGSAFSALRGFNAEALAGAEFAVVSGITPALGEPSRTLTDAFVAAARERGVRLCVDVNYRALLWSAAAARATLSGLVAAAAVVVCSIRDARHVFELDGADADAAARFAARFAPGAETVVITRSEQGADLFSGGETIRCAALPARVVDRFGAGDAFTAGLLWGLLEGRSRAEALEAAAALASLKCTIVGDSARFRRDELEAAMRAPAGEAILR